MNSSGRLRSWLAIKVAPLTLTLASLLCHAETTFAQKPTLRTTLQGFPGEVRSIAFSPDGKSLLTTCENSKLEERIGEIKLWDLATGKAIVVVRDRENPEWQVAFRPDGKFFATATGQRARVWDAATLKEKWALPKGQGAGCLAFSPDGKILATGGAAANVMIDQIKLWDAASGEEKDILRSGNLGAVAALAFSPDGKTLAASLFTLTPQVILWDVATGKSRLTIKSKDHPIWSVAFSPDGKTLVTGGDDKGVKFWDAGTGQLKANFKAHRDWITTVAYHPGGKMVVSGSRDRTVKLWDVNTAELLATLKEHQANVTVVAWSPDGKTLATASEDKTVKLWDMPVGEAKEK
jgi:WD40 repeat protein